MPDLYELAPTPHTPELPGTVVVRETPDDLIDAIAADLTVQSMACSRQFGSFHLALSGGSTPQPLYMRLMYDPSYRQLPWGRTHLWIVDERRVPLDDDRSNFKMINEIIGLHSGIPAEQVHPIPATADDADQQYQRTLQESLAWREKGQDRLDYVLLGMGSDAHTASLFPHSPALKEETAPARNADNGDHSHLVRINAGPNVTPPDRVTMTLRLINASRFIGVMVTGESKRETIARVSAAYRASRSGAEPRPGQTVDDLPILGVRPIGGELRWYLDHAACPRPEDAGSTNGAR